jgi:hypothetical protein
MSEGPSCAPLLMALLPDVGAPVEYEAKLVSYFDPVIAQIFRERIFYCCFGVHRRHLIKNLTSLRVSPVRKRVQALEIKKLLLLWRLVYTSRDPRLQF